jgi:phenylalanyl-tRNA synthetase alpha chain
MRDLLASLDGLRERLREIPQADAQRLQDLRTEILGRKHGALTDILKALPTLDAQSRKAVGGAANALKQEFAAAIAAREQALASAGPVVADMDPTMPGRASWQGGLHVVTQVVEEICDIFRELGFTRAVGPEIETERNNFYALNFPHDHPALDSQDSFYVTNDLLLRTHTSPVQIRTMEAYPPPIRVVIPGQVYRRDPFDASHAPVFEQIEGLVVDEGVSFVDLKATLSHFARRFFAADAVVRFHPSFFPFTEPSADMSVRCTVCGGRGCPTCKQSGWMEILGSGMVHPAVLENCGIDAERYTGFAFGMGPHRIAMLRYGIPDIRLFYESDVRFLTQFAGQLPGGTP